MSGWIKTEHCFPIHAGRYTVGHRNLMMAAERGRIREADALRIAINLRPQDPDTVEKAFAAVLLREHPELAGGQLIWIKMRHFFQWEFTWLHPSLPAWREGSEDGGVEAVPLLLPPGHRMVRRPDGTMMEWVDVPNFAPDLRGMTEGEMPEAAVTVIQDDGFIDDGIRAEAGS